LTRLVHLKSLQQFNAQLIRNLNDAIYTLTRATKVIYIVGKKIIDERDNEAPKQNLRDLITVRSQPPAPTPFKYCCSVFLMTLFTDKKRS
jgi:hypothetical protein